MLKINSVQIHCAKYSETEVSGATNAALSLNLARSPFQIYQNWPCFTALTNI